MRPFFWPWRIPKPVTSRSPWEGICWNWVQGAMKESSSKTRDQIKVGEQGGKDCKQWYNLLQFEVMISSLLPHTWWLFHLSHIFTYFSFLHLFAWAFRSLSEWDLSGVWGSESSQLWAASSRFGLWAHNWPWLSYFIPVNAVCPNLLSFLVLLSWGASEEVESFHSKALLAQERVMTPSNKACLEGSFKVVIVEFGFVNPEGSEPSAVVFLAGPLRKGSWKNERGIFTGPGKWPASPPALQWAGVLSHLRGRGELGKVVQLCAREGEEIGLDWGGGAVYSGLNCRVGSWQSDRLLCAGDDNDNNKIHQSLET